MACSIACAGASPTVASKLNDHNLSSSLFSSMRNDSASFRSRVPAFRVSSGCRNAKSQSSGKAASVQALFNFEKDSNKGVASIPSKIFALGVSSMVLFGPFSAIADTLVNDACAEEFGGTDVNTVILIACILEGIALTGAFVGGSLARVRKQELERINAQLRQINFNLRRQARVESYAPGLSYAPIAPTTSNNSAPTAAVESVKQESPSNPVAEVEVPGKVAILRKLKAGKKCLRERNPHAAFKEFKVALSMAREMGDTVELKKAARGLGASCQRQGKHLEAIKYHQMVLDASKVSKENSGNTEAYGAIADCYTEIGDLENAAKYYDLYINGLETTD